MLGTWQGVNGRKMVEDPWCRVYFYTVDSKAFVFEQTCIVYYFVNMFLVVHLTTRNTWCAINFFINED